MNEKKIEKMSSLEYQRPTHHVCLCIFAQPPQRSRGGPDLGLVALPPSTFAARRVGPGTCLQGPGVEIEGGPDLPDILRGETRNNSYVHVPGMAVYPESLLLRNTGESLPPSLQQRQESCMSNCKASLANSFRAL